MQCPFIYSRNATILPRQARDKHRENPKNSVAVFLFLQAAGMYTITSTAGDAFRARFVVMNFGERDREIERDPPIKLSTQLSDQLLCCRLLLPPPAASACCCCFRLLLPPPPAAAAAACRHLHASEAAQGRRHPRIRRGDVPHVTMELRIHRRILNWRPRQAGEQMSKAIPQYIPPDKTIKWTPEGRHT